MARVQQRRISVMQVMDGFVINYILHNVNYRQFRL